MNHFAELPIGWVETTLGDLMLKLQYGYTASASYEALGTRFLRITDIQKGAVDWNTVPGCEITDEDFEKYQLEDGDFVFARTGSIEKAWRVSGVPKAVFASYLIRGKLALPDVAPWLEQFIHTLSYLTQIGAAGAGIGRENVNAKKLAQINLPIPPLNEQRRIVAKIEALKARSQQVKEALEAIPLLLEQFRQSVLAAAFRGDLTADWREKNPNIEPALELLKRNASQLNKNLDEEIKKLYGCKLFTPDRWTRTPLNLLIKNIQAGKNFSCPEVPVTEDTIGLVKISAVTWGFFDERETKTVADQTKIDPSLFIQKGDFLISRANTIELVGASVVVDEINYKIMLSDKVWRVKFLEVKSKYINFYLKSEFGRKEIESRATGNQLSMRNISQNAFREIVIALPPQKEQKEIVHRIEAFFKAVDKIEQQYQEVKAHLELLDQSILAKAFRGELVPQDPNDEPASILLERIRTERVKREAEAKAAKKSTGKTTGRRSRKAKQQDSESNQLELPGLE